jgi:hypothetical protein
VTVDIRTDFDRPWLGDLLDLPDTASWPRLLTPPHPLAVGSYGRDVEAYTRRRLGVTMRWWQRLATRMQYQHDAEGRLLVREVLESTPRRAGKSVRLRATAMHRVEWAAHLGEEQLALHTGKDLPICKEIHRRMWPWALRPEQKEAGWSVRRTNGQEELQAPDGSRWMVRGRDSVYGYDVCLGMVDEAWGVEPGVVDDGLEPATLERIQPQLLLTSTAHRRTTSLMPVRMAAARLGDGADTGGGSLLMLWGAPPDADLRDRRMWRAASPHWTPERERMIEDKLRRAVAGEQIDPDEPDPLAAFRAQYLNVWPEPDEQSGESAVDVNTWLRAVRPGGVIPAGAAMFGGVDVAPDGRDVFLIAAAVDDAGRPVVQVARHLPSGGQRQVADLLIEWHRARPNLVRVGFDPFTSATAAQWAAEGGVPMDPVQGMGWGRAWRDLADRTAAGISHPHSVGEPGFDVLLRHMASARTRESGEHVSLSRARSVGPISGVVALMIAVYELTAAPAPPEAFRIL